MAGKAAWTACILVAGLFACAPGSLATSGFVSVNSAGTGFSTPACPDFVLSGYNTWQPIEAAANLIGTGAAVGPQFDLAVKYNLNVIRMFGFSVQQGINNQYAPGNYNESMLVAFDNVIAAAGARNLRLIVALANNWDYNGNMSDCKCWYTNQSRTATGCDDFFTDSNAISYYLQNARTIMNRVNTVTKVAYNKDPAIMAWDLINEGRCEANCTAANVQSWINTVAPTIKGYAGSQLVTVGQDGFWQADNCASNTMNPVANSDGWPLRTGQDFLPNHAVNGIDFMSIHMWPDNWDRTDLDFGKAWLNGHLAQARLLKKPLILEEFGKAVTNGSDGLVNQTPQQQLGYYQLAYAITEGSIDTGDALRGIAFWRWDSVDPQAQLTGFDQEATITTSGNIFQQVIQPFSQRMAFRCAAAEGTPTTSPAASSQVAGRRRLAQQGAPGPASRSSTAPVQAPSQASSQSTVSNSIVTGNACQVNETVPGGSTPTTATGGR